MLKLITALLALAFCSSALAADAGAGPQSQEDRIKAIRALGWAGAGNYPLSASHSVLAIPQGYQVLVGEDARKFVTLSGDPRDDSVEALVVNLKSSDAVFFQTYGEGHVSLDDWSDVDAAEMLSQIRSGTEEANKERRQQGVSTLQVIGWLQQPTLQRDSSTVYWALEGSDGQEAFVNSVALRRGREGYEELIWVTAKDTYVAAGGDLAAMLKAHSFDQGHRYGDFVAGDKVATYGIAGLVAAVAGAKVLKVAGLGVLLVLLKKFGVVIIAVIGGLIYKLRRGFRKSAT
jgi:uncharacterized membrane-anchored protein